MNTSNIAAKNRSWLGLALGCLLLFPTLAFAQFPTTAYGWNLGNTLEASGGEGSWAPAASQALIDQVSASGFNTVRLPVNWAIHIDSQNVIDPTWLARVKEVVDWCLAKDMPVIINMHHDGWFDSSGFSSFDTNLNAKYVKIWQQIAQYFQAYDSRLMFCAANEPWVDNQTEANVLKQYYQNFINTVRSTGGNNTNRWLILPGPDTNIDKTYDWFTLPTDPTPGRLAVDVHYYDPFGFCLQVTDETWGQYSYFWGSEVAGYRTTVSSLLHRNTTWGEEDWLAGQIAKMKTKFVDNGVPVMFGEFAAGKRIGYAELTGTEYDRHLASRTYFDKKVVELCNAAGIKPYFWDNGWSGKDGFNLFDRNTAAVMEQDQVTALTGGAATPPPDGGGGCTASATSVSSIVVTTINAGGGNKRGQATVTVVSNCGTPVAGATVTGNFSGSISQSGASAVTNSSGVATLQTSGTAKGKVNLTFCVTNITMSGLTYNSSANVETCDNN